MRMRRSRSAIARAVTLFLANLLIVAGLSVVSPSIAHAAPSGVAGSIVLGSGNYFKTIDSSDFVMGAGNFTFETWVHPTSRPSSDFTGIISIGMPSDLTNSINQLEIIERTLNDSQLLLEAEKQLFVSGESSLFLINARELAFIQARLKFIECTVKVQQASLTYTFAIAGFY